jgi:aminoglycoside/choline kinase family phosphotransferase
MLGCGEEEPYVSDRTTTDAMDALRAWGRVGTREARVQEVCVLKKERSKSRVYRLHGAAPDGGSVIAKRCASGRLRVERLLYEEVLHRLGVSVPKYYGFFSDGEEEEEWIFLEDSGDRPFAWEDPRCRAAGIAWLNSMHSAATTAAAPYEDGLPRRDPDHYRRCICDARGNITRSLDSSSFRDPRHPRTLRHLLSQLNHLENRWEQLVAPCAGFPKTLVHADFVSKNVRLKEEADGVKLFPVDWETAGWGTPAIDLAGYSEHISGTRLSDYSWWCEGGVGSADLEPVKALVRVGMVFRLTLGIQWATEELPYRWRSKALWQLHWYSAKLKEPLSRIGVRT